MPRKPSCLCGECPKCRARVAARERYQSLSREERRAIVARRDPVKARAAGRASYRRHREKVLAANRERARRNAGQRTAAKRQWERDNPDKKRAHAAVRRALKSGRLVRPDACEVCGTTEHKVHAHHDDHSRQLDVRWMCPTCHANEHTRRKDPA